MSMVRLVTLDALPCGCVVGRYRDLRTLVERTYIDEKARTCSRPDHRRNGVVAARRPGAARPPDATTMRPTG